MGNGYTHFGSRDHGAGDDDQNILTRWLGNSANVLGLGVVEEPDKLLSDLVGPSNTRAVHSEQRV